MSTDESGQVASVAWKVDVPPMLAELAPACGCPQALAAAFEAMYAHANGEAERVPWCRAHACPRLIEWLNTHAPRVVRPGCRAVVVGAALGDDVAELAERGYDVMGFDIAPTAVRWAARRHPGWGDRFFMADVFAVPPRLVHRFDLVVEIDTLGMFEPSLRVAAARGLARLLSPRGVLLVVARAARARGGEGAGEHDGEEAALREASPARLGPPFGFERDELVALMSAAGLTTLGGDDGDHAAAVQPCSGEGGPDGERRWLGVFRPGCG